MGGSERAEAAPTRTPAGRGERKVPRVDLRKFLGGGAAGRREVVDALGDALRERAAVRVEGHGAAPTDAVALRTVAHAALAALADYFGLPADTLQPGGGSDLLPLSGPAAAEEAADRSLLLLLAPLPAGLQLRGPDGGWELATAHSAELLLVSGGALARLTGGVVPAGAVRWPPGETPAGTDAWALAAPPGELAALPEFAPDAAPAARQDVGQ